MKRRHFLAAPAAAWIACGQQEDLRADLVKTLKDNILAFWHPRCLDTAGGYMVDFDAQGQPKPSGRKMIVTQARMLWFFSRMARAGLGDRKAMLAAAGHGWRFLSRKMYDERLGGFYWEVDAAGTQITRSAKHLYGQSFGLYALGEYALASGRTDVLDFAGRFFDVLERRAHDGEHGGYRESFQVDWSPGRAGEISPMGLPHELKLMNTHMHLMEALSTYYRASRRGQVRERLRELIGILSNAVIRKELPAGTDQYTEEWTPVLKGAGARISYGHDMENVWLLHDACDAAGQSFSPYLDLCRGLWKYALRYGWDNDRGGFFYTGDFNQPADNRVKSWWVQAEALVSALTMWKLTGEPDYFERFRKTWQFVTSFQIDRERGEWHESVQPDGRGTGNKGSAWKAAYHNGRAMIECERLLRAG